MDKINVSLFGGKSLFGGRETPLEAHIIFCDKYENCSFYKNGKCLNQRSFFTPYCCFGKIKTVKGYTSKAMKYSSFKLKYINDEVYEKLKYPSNELIGIIEDKIVLKVPYLRIDYENGQYKFNNYGNGNLNCIETKNFNIDILYKICTHKPQALMGGTISDYANKQIPELLQQLKKIMPNLYRDFIEQYPQYDLKPNYIGKYAYINSMVIGSQIKDSNSNVFIYDGEYLICDNWKSYFVPFSGNVSYMKIKVTDKMKYKVTNNNQCNENTVFD